MFKYDEYSDDSSDSGDYFCESVDHIFDKYFSSTDSSDIEDSDIDWDDVEDHADSLSNAEDMDFDDSEDQSERDDYDADYNNANYRDADNTDSGLESDFQESEHLDNEE